MSTSTASLRRKIDSAGDLQSVVRSMKALAASRIGQYEKSVAALGDYYQTVELGLGECFRKIEPSLPLRKASIETVAVIVFGSDQGLVGQFNDGLADFVVKSLAALAGKPQVWAVGERVYSLLSDAGLSMKELFAVPSSVKAITPLVGQIQVETSSQWGQGLYVFHNRPQPGALYEPVMLRLLPLDAQWQASLAKTPWPTRSLPEVIFGVEATLASLIREHLFISLFRACAESLASENASRLAAMERADKNIVDLLEALQSRYHRLRQSAIDEELFDVVSGFEALSVSPVTV